MSDVDEALRAFTEAYEPSEADRARVKRRLLAKAAGVGLVASLVAKGSLAAPLVSSPIAGQSLGALSKLFVGSMLVTFAGAGAVVAVTRELSTPEQRSAVHVAPKLPRAPAPEAKRATKLDANEAIAPAAGVTSAPSGAVLERVPLASSTAPPDPSAKPGAELEAELALLREARAASTSGNHERARRLLDALDLRHPRGLLLEERSALRVISECEATGAAKSRASTFLERYRTSVYASKVRRACGLDGEPSRTPAAKATATFADPEPTGH